MWKNCRLYNSRPSDEPVREMCSEVEQEFKKLWTKAGLEGLESAHDQPIVEAGGDKSESEGGHSLIQIGYTEVQESSVPEQYNVFRGMISISRCLTLYCYCLYSRTLLTFCQSL